MVRSRAIMPPSTRALLTYRSRNRPVRRWNRCRVTLWPPRATLSVWFGRAATGTTSMSVGSGHLGGLGRCRRLGLDGAGRLRRAGCGINGVAESRRGAGADLAKVKLRRDQLIPVAVAAVVAHPEYVHVRLVRLGHDQGVQRQARSQGVDRRNE